MFVSGFGLGVQILAPLPLPVTVSGVPPADEPAEYMAGTDNLIVGSNAANQRLVSLSNPAASGKTVRVVSCVMGAVAQAAAGTAFLHMVARVSGGAPGGGMVAQAEKRRSSDGAPVAVVRTSPNSGGTGTGMFWVGCIGVYVTAAGSFLGGQVEAVLGNQWVLTQGESLLVLADMNPNVWRHWVSLTWIEVDP